MVVVAGKAGVVREVFGRIDAREGAEVVDEVCLIEIAAIESDIRPANGTPRRDAAKDRLEAANAAEELRGQANVMLEEFDEAAGADVGRLRGVEKRFDGVFNRRMVLKHASGALEESDFEGAEFAEGSRSFEDAVAELSRKESPKIAEFEMLIAKFSAGELEKWNRTGGTEGDADDVVLFLGVDSEGFGLRAGESATIEGEHFASVVRIVETDLVFGEVDDNGDAAVGHEAFFGVGLRVVPVIPKELDKARERRAGSEKQPFHGGNGTTVGRECERGMGGDAEIEEGSRASRGMTGVS
jgi:hypothetical protein